MILTRENIAEMASKAAQVLRTGGVVLYPTDTLYGLGADALSDEAVARLYMLKGRDEHKPIHAIVSDLEMVSQYGEVDERVRTLILKLPKGKVSCIVRKKEGVERGIAKSIDTFGFRIPDHAFCQAMLAAYGGPITATSANLAGKATGRSADEILAQIGERVDLVIDAGELAVSAPSTVVDVSQRELQIVREGAVSAEEVRAAVE